MNPPPSRHPHERTPEGFSMNSRGSKTPGKPHPDIFYPGGVVPSPSAPSPPRNRHLLLRLLALPVILTTLIIGGSACGTLVTDVGPRGDAHLYAQSGGFIMGPPPFRLDVNPVPLNDRRTYVLKTKNLGPQTFSAFSLEVRSRGLRAAKSRLAAATITSPPGKDDHPQVRIRIHDATGHEILAKTVGTPGHPWRSAPSKWRAPILTQNLSRDAAHPPKPRHPSGDLTFTVEILQPSALPGQFLHISSSRF